MTNNEKLAYVQHYFKQSLKKYDDFVSKVETHIKEKKPKLEKLGYVDDILNNNGLKLNQMKYEKIRIEFDKSRVNQDISEVEQLNQTATKDTKKFLENFLELKSEMIEFKNKISNVSIFENYEVYEKFLNEKFSKIEQLKKDIKKYVDDELEEHISSFDRFRKYEEIYSNIVSKYDLSSMKSHRLNTDLHDKFEKSYIIYI